MPRIPEGGFRTDPSTRVERERASGIDTGVSKLRQLGSGFLNISDQMEKASAKADALNAANKFDQSFENEITPDLDALEKSSKAGFVVGPDQKEVSYSETVSKTIDEYDNKVKADIGDNIQALEYYNRYTVPKLEAKRGKARVFESAQKEKHLSESIDTEIETLNQRRINNMSTSLDIASLSDKIMASSEVIGQEAADKKLAGLHRQLAYNSSNLITNNGYNTENDREARKYFKYLPEGERLAVERQYDKTVTSVKKAQVDSANKSFNKFMDDVKSFKDFSLARDKFNKLAAEVVTTPLGNEETKEDKISKAGRLFGKQFSFMAVTAMPDGKESDYEQMVDQLFEENIARGLAGTQLGEYASTDELKKAITNNAMMEYNAIVDKRDRQPGGAMEFYADLNGSIEDDIASGNEVRRDTGFAGLFSFFKATGVPEDMQTIVMPDAARGLGKTFTEIGKGDLNTAGDMAWEQVKNLGRQYGEYSHKAARDAVSLGGGTTNNTSVPPIITVGSKIVDDSFGKQMMGHYYQKDQNVDALIDRGEVASKAKFNKEVNNSFSESPFSNVFFGRKGENKALYSGLKDAISARTAWYAAEKKVPVREAYSNAMRDFNQYLRVGKSGMNTAMVDRTFLDKYDLTNNQLNRMTSNISELKYLDKAGVEIDFDFLANNSKNNAFLGKHSEIFKKAKLLGGYEEQRKMLIDSMGDNIFVANDPDNANAVKVFIRPVNGEPIALPVKKYDREKGAMGTSELRLSLEEYYKAQSLNTPGRGTAGDSPRAMFHRMAQ